MKKVALPDYLCGFDAVASLPFGHRMIRTASAVAAAAATLMISVAVLAAAGDVHALMKRFIRDEDGGDSRKREESAILRLDQSKHPARSR